MFKRLFQRYSKKTAIAIIALSLTLAVGVAGTLAFLVDKTFDLINSFYPGEIEITVNSDATFTVSGDAPAYIRVAIVVNYQNDAGNISNVGAKENTHYEVTESLANSGWVKGGDGYYYYTKPVSVGGKTDPLLVTIKSLVLSPDFEDPTTQGYRLTAQCLATGVQAEPANAVIEAWGATLDANGTITKIP